MAKEERPRFFEAALSDFTHDAASGRAIRHLVDLGCTTNQIMERLDYPTPRARVEQTVYRHMKETGILREALPGTPGEKKNVTIKDETPSAFIKYIRECIDRNGEENSYISCPFGTIYRDREVRMKRLLASLTPREQEYILGIPWERKMMYHRLTSRMTEIGIQLAIHSEMEFRFYFLRSGETVVFQNISKGVL